MNGNRSFHRHFISFGAAVVLIFVAGVVRTQPAAAADASAGMNWTAQQDHQNMMEQLGIKKLRAGPSGQAGNPNSANYDPAKANPYPDLPEALVLKNGQIIPIADGYRCAKAGEGDAPVTISLGATCVTLQASEALRLSISGAAFPAFPVNPGTGEDPTNTPTARARVIATGIRFGEGRQSLLRLSIPD